MPLPAADPDLIVIPYKYTRKAPARVIDWSFVEPIHVVAPIVVGVMVAVPLFVLAITEQFAANVQVVLDTTAAGGFVASTTTTSPLVEACAMAVANVVAAFAHVS
jgi:phage-related protein